MYSALLALGCQFTITLLERKGKSSFLKMEDWGIAEESTVDKEPIPYGVPLDEGSPSGSKSVFKPAEFYSPRDEL